MRLSELAKAIGAEIVGAVDDPEIRGVAPIQSAEPGEVTFLTSPEYARFLPTTRASAVILAKKPSEEHPPLLIHENPYWAFAKAAQIFAPKAPGEDGEGFVSEKAEIAKDAVIGSGVKIHPFAVVASGARIGARAILYPGVYVGPNAEVGDDTVLRANVVLEYGVKVGRRCLIHAGAVIGADGFGFAPGRDGNAKIPQQGSVVIGDDVEIGANTTIDRGAMADTVIGDGTKLDSHAHVAHNVVIGKHTMICGMSALGGSCKLGDRVIIGGHSAVNNHIEVGDGVILGGHSGLTKGVDEPGTYLGFPAQPANEWRKVQVALKRLPELIQKMRRLEKVLGEKSAAE